MKNKKIPWDIAFFIIFMAVIPYWLGDSYFFDTINIIGIYAIAIIGLNLILGLTGIISLGHAAFFGLGAYFSAYLSIHYALSPFLSIVISCMLVCLVALLFALPLLRLSGYFMAVGTLGVGIIIHTLVNGGGEMTGGPNGLSSIPTFSAGSFAIDSFIQHFYLIWLTVFLVYLLVKNLMNSKQGRAMKAIHSDEAVAETFGIRILQYKTKVFVLGCTLAALAGGYYAHYMAFISPDILSPVNSINMLLMGVLGGLGSYLGPVTGSFAFQLIPQLSSLIHEYEVLIKGIILLLAILFLPMGIQGAIGRGLTMMQTKMRAQKSAPNSTEFPDVSKSL